MDERAYLYEGETLLLALRPAASMLVRACLRSLFDAFVFGVVASMLIAGAWWFALGRLPHVAVFVVIGILIFAALMFRRTKLWQQSMLRITNDRILVQFPNAEPQFVTDKPGGALVAKKGVFDLFASVKQVTIKWGQYQESSTKRGTIVDTLWHAKHVCVRYGTADAHRQICFVPVLFATDVKHYMDKVDSANKAGKLAELRPFIAKPKGQRD